MSSSESTLRLQMLLRSEVNRSSLDHLTDAELLEMTKKVLLPRSPLPLIVTGIVPHRIWISLRIKDLRLAIDRYEKATVPVPEEWTTELHCLHLSQLTQEMK